MTTIPHRDGENGYSLRVSKNLPPNSTNLAYIKSDTPSTKKNLLIEQNIKNISENRMSNQDTSISKMFSKKDMKLETESGINSFSKQNIDLTDEYNIFTEAKEPLFYISKSKGLIDIRSFKVFPYINGSQISQELRYEELNINNRNSLVYKENKILVTKENNIPLNSNELFKIKLVQEGTNLFTYRILIYANFDINSNSYEIHYKNYDTKKETKEVLNFSSIFEKVALSEMKLLTEEQKLTKKVYAVEGDSKVGYTFYAPNPVVSLPDIDENSRPAHQFEYFIESNLSTRISDKNKANINIGLIYVNETSFNQKNISSAGKKLFQNNTYMPDYLTFQNPHSTFGMNLKEQYEYWIADINMPPEHYLDYDILIISGYGQKDFNKYNSSLVKFLNNGGVLFYDNCGKGNNVLNNTVSENNTFINSINFSNTQTYQNTREYSDIKLFGNRYYELKDATFIGEVSPKIIFSGKETESDWKVLLNHKSEGSSILIKENEYNGKLIVSNAGLMLDVLMGNIDTIKLLTNMIIFFTENRFFKSPVIKEYLYHKDNLFKKEYVDNSKAVYIEDKNDLDSTQLVAKKILKDSISETMKNYIPEYFRNSTGLYTPKVRNSGILEIPNASFERTNSKNEVLWTKNTTNAIPNWNVEVISGAGSATFEHIDNFSKMGNYSIKLKTTNSRASWFTSLGNVTAGNYSLEMQTSYKNSEAFSIGIYDTKGVLLHESKSLEGSSSWEKITFSFKTKKSEELILKIGTHKANKSIEAFFDDVVIHAENTVRMNLTNNGNESLYAYATASKGEGVNLAYNNLKEDSILKENTILNSEVIIKSYVYQWNNEEAVYKKKYGNETSIPFQIKNSDGTKVLSKLISWIPPLNDGAEWADKTRVYYEIQMKEINTSNYINLEIYDPSINKHFYTSEGIAAINYNDLFWNSYDSTVVVRAKTSFYGLKITNRHYDILFKKDYEIEVLSPATLDERDRWYPRIKNGTFQKKSISAKELEEMSSIGIENYYQDKLIGIHEYSIPEYEKQPFFPKYGEREITSEKAEYVSPFKIKVQRNPLSITEENVVKENLNAANKERTIFNSNNNWWNEDVLPIIYWDELSNGKDVVINYKYKINYELGSIEFETPIPKGLVKATYTHDNFKIVKRTYKNERINNELLKTRDGFTFLVSKNNITNYPQPTIYKGRISPENIIHPNEIKINFKAGSITFFEKIEERIYIDYNYYIEEELEYNNVNIREGQIFLNKRISFKDEIYVSYIYKENYFEYKGYYDKENMVFMSLDLNPTTGHTYVERETNDFQTLFVSKPTENLLGKEVYLYILPSKSSFNTIVRTEEDCVRHVFSYEEWENIKKTSPEAILLAKIQIRENTIIDNTIVMDARSRGGGLKETISSKKIEEKTGYTSNYWDIGSFEGLPYYKNAVNIIQLPISVLKNNGGNFEEDDILKIVSKYMSYGEMPIIEYVKDEE